MSRPGMTNEALAVNERQLRRPGGIMYWRNGGVLEWKELACHCVLVSCQSVIGN